MWTMRIPGADVAAASCNAVEPAAERVGDGARARPRQRAHIDVEREQRLAAPHRRELQLRGDAQRPVDALRDCLLQRLDLLVAQVGVDERGEVRLRVGADRSDEPL